MLSADSTQESIASKTFRTLASKDVHTIGLVQQCLFLDSCLGTSTTATILNRVESATSALAEAKNTIRSKDRNNTVQDAGSHESTSLASQVNWLRVWEAARDRGPYWTRTTQRSSSSWPRHCSGTERAGNVPRLSHPRFRSSNTLLRSIAPTPLISKTS